MTELAALLHRIAEQPSLHDLVEHALQDSPARLHTAPAIESARVPITAILATQSNRPLLYVVSSGEAAMRAYEDLRMWLGPDAALIFPANDALPYEHMSPGADVVAGRLRVLHALAGAQTNITPLVVVASIKALIQPTLAPAELAEATVSLRVGEQHDLEALMARWIAMGYRSAPTVEEPGEMNRRGGIVDIFPLNEEQPLRIEFFGDEVDSLRRFDPITQRSEGLLEQAVVGPPHEFPLWRRETALERMRAVDQSQLRPEARAEWAGVLEQLAEGETFESRGFFAPLFYDLSDSTALAAHSLLAYLPPAAAAVWSELALLQQHIAELEQQAEDRRLAQLEAGELPPEMPRPYLTLDMLLNARPDIALLNLGNNPDLLGLPEVAPPWQAHTLLSNLFVPAPLFGGQFKQLVLDILDRLHQRQQVTIITPQAARLQELVDEAVTGRNAVAEPPPDMAELLTILHGTLDVGWFSPLLDAVLYTDTEIFGWRQRRVVVERKRKRDRTAEERATFLRGLKPGDYVVHIEHGIALYEGMVRRVVGGVEREYLNLRYAGDGRLYVPVDQVDRVSRYIGAGDAAPTLTRLGTQDWEKAKRKARDAVQDLALDLLALYARRRLLQGYAFSPDTPWQRELEASFPYIETGDQLRSIEEVKQDMEQPMPMDRLICGDVGFGKTEVALRAAFKAIQDGRQVAVLVPTTVLAQQHFETFTRRMAAFPVRIEMLSRFRTPKEQDQVVAGLLNGAVDIVIGTHRLLSKDVSFKNLGLLVVDEEQRFGVRHKERLKQLRANVDVLTLTATPIPRTLHMALAGIRDLSVIDTPPEDRVPIKTYVLPYDESLISAAITREIDRGGQIYFVHNRVYDIYEVSERLRRLIPEARIAVGHGQLTEHQLERVMLDFFTGKHDVLVCTTIIESGLDVPTANTIIIDDATNYGLAQLYQLRGRVGRSAQRAYAYLFFRGGRQLTAEAQERLQAIQEATDLGAGFRIAMRDLEIRGAGNLLGAEQSGHIAAVGFDLYSRLLEQAVKTLKEQFNTTGILPGANSKRAEPERLPAEAFEQLPQAELPPPPQLPPAPPKKTRRAVALRDRFSGPMAAEPAIVIDEKVLVSPLVTLELPLDSYLPIDYIPDERVRLAVYQQLADAQTPRQVREVRQMLRDRFGKPPEPAEHLLTWLQIKALALDVGIKSIVTSDDEFIIRLPDGDTIDRDKLQKRFGRSPAVRIGPQFVRLNRRLLNDERKWIGALIEVLELIAR